MATRDTVSTLYNGRHTVTYRNGNHRYYIENKVVPSVTTIMGQVMAKPDLMLWPMNMALNYLEERLPTITADDLNMARTAHVRRREGGANTGTAVHYLTEQRLALPMNRRLNLDPSNIPQDVVVAAMAFEKWYLEVAPKVLAVEQIVYSPTLGYVGTFDSVLKIDGKTYLCDVKTTNAARQATRGIYPEHFIQIGAYYTAYEEQRQYELANGGTKLKPIDDFMVISAKKTGVVDTLTGNNIGLSLDKAASVWRSVMELYAHMAQLKLKIGEIA